MNSGGRLAWRECFLLLLVAGVPAAISFWVRPDRPTWVPMPTTGLSITLDDSRRLGSRVLWVDAREGLAFEKEHIPGAVLLNETGWERLLPEFLAAWRPGSMVVVYCDSEKCSASEEVARRLQRELDLTEVHVLQGGWQTWINARH